MKIKLAMSYKTGHKYVRGYPMSFLTFKPFEATTQSNIIILAIQKDCIMGVLLENLL